jgi:hypothetical protein
VFGFQIHQKKWVSSANRHSRRLAREHPHRFALDHLQTSSRMRQRLGRIITQVENVARCDVLVMVTSGPRLSGGVTRRPSQAHADHGMVGEIVIK